MNFIFIFHKRRKETNTGCCILGFTGSEIRVPIIIGIIVARYIALPLLGIAIVKGAIRFGLVHSDPLYNFILLLQFAVPPAMNISMLHTRRGKRDTFMNIS